MHPETLVEHIRKMKAATDRPWGVNVPHMYPELDRLMAILIREEVKIVFTSAGSPKKFTPMLHEAGVTVAHVVSSSKFARKCEEAGVDAIVGRGGGCYSVEGGIYKIDDRLIQDTKAAKGGLYHSSMLGVQMADVLHKKYGGIMIMMNPPIVDELCDLARVTGVDGVYRRAVCHALNLKETARRQALSLGKKYEDCNFIVCHIDGSGDHRFYGMHGCTDKSER